MTKTAQKLLISSAALAAAEKKMEENRAKKMVWTGHEMKGQLDEADKPPISPSNWKPAFLDLAKKQQEASEPFIGEAVDTVRSKAYDASPRELRGGRAVTRGALAVIALLLLKRRRRKRRRRRK
ncbi:unnamed protein product [Amoebophrya sp. A120]|nr:unnamed protein product [Amoebophrya sp. A120]|eukprot:GSA120T00014506001.1